MVETTPVPSPDAFEVHVAQEDIDLAGSDLPEAHEAFTRALERSFAAAGLEGRVYFIRDEIAHFIVRWQVGDKWYFDRLPNYVDYFLMWHLAGWKRVPGHPAPTPFSFWLRDGGQGDRYSGTRPRSARRRPLDRRAAPVRRTS